MSKKGDYFWVFIIGESSSGAVRVVKTTFDKEKYFNIPDDKQKPNLHPFVVKSTLYSSFLTYLNNKKHTGKPYIRHIPFKIRDFNQEITEEANCYLNKNLVFEFDGNILLAEDDYLANVETSTIDKKEANMTSEKLLELYDNVFLNCFINL